MDVCKGGRDEEAQAAESHGQDLGPFLLGQERGGPGLEVGRRWWQVGWYWQLAWTKVMGGRSVHPNIKLKGGKVLQQFGCS